ncbi:MAG: glycosyltransferase [Chitinophagaceae bacterium]|nr:glycosyltransferase [Chitinophagaceae bacterium]
MRKQHIRWYFSKKHIKLDLQYYIRIMQFIRKSNPDVIFLHGSAYILPARFAALFSKRRSKIIVRETQANHLKTQAQWVSLTGAMFLANHIVCLTGDFKKQIQKKLGWLYRSNKVRVISNGINLDLYRPGNKTAGSQVVIGMQSRLVKIKDHLTLLKAFSILKKKTWAQLRVKLRIAGDGDLKKNW